ncbi:PilX N-terminal domain-containing pilus assembly protein [Aquisalimonas sp.]|uniref:pilus assembly PilX family protein n=1 Tax=unclassified Aquisalimonas TaxID=2644645 RepID=UPI0025C26223|nr:PilX N-terminal domain-containing pilus assembly protein [Aquisalimonas sp.]
MSQARPRLICSSPQGARQRGAALIVSLILLVVMTLIGVFAMRGTTLEERMAGNMRDRSLAFEAGESGLRDAERWLDSLDGPIQFDGPHSTPFTFHYSDDDRPTHPSDVDGSDLASWTAADHSPDGVSREPEFVVEQRPFSLDQEMGSLGADREPDVGSDQLFRIMVRAWGGSTSNDPAVYLESQYRPE